MNEKLPICPICHLPIMPEEEEAAHRWCSPTAEGDDEEQDEGQDVRAH